METADRSIADILFEEYLDKQCRRINGEAVIHATFENLEEKY